MATNVNMHTLRTNGKCLRCGSESHSLQECTRPGRKQPFLAGKGKNEPNKEPTKAKGRTAEAQPSKP